MKCNYKSPFFLYVMVYFTMVGSCSNASNTKQVEIINKLDAIEQKIEKLEKPIFDNISGALTWMEAK